jgi:hypothetical protein
MAIRPYFTLYFLPLFPIGGASSYVRCMRCRSNFDEAVLDYQPPAEILGHVEPRPEEVEAAPEVEAAGEPDPMLVETERDLRSGTSLATMQHKLVGQGLTDPQAQQLIRQACGGFTRTCRCGQQFHGDVRQCNHCGARV